MIRETRTDAAWQRCDVHFLRNALDYLPRKADDDCLQVFPNDTSCLRLIRALCAETYESWLDDSRYLNMAFLAEQKKEQLRLAA